MGTNWVLSCDGKDSFSPSATESINHLRYLELVTKLAQQSNQSFQDCCALSLLQPIATGLASGDALLMMNLLDFIPLIAETHDGLVYLFDSGLVRHLINVANGALGCSICVCVCFTVSRSTLRRQCPSHSWYTFCPGCTV